MATRGVRSIPGSDESRNIHSSHKNNSGHQGRAFEVIFSLETPHFNNVIFFNLFPVFIRYEKQQTMIVTIDTSKKFKETS